MDIEIQSKTNNPLFKRTEVYFTIHHDGEGTPKREFIKSELAQKLNAKKENIMINYMKSSFGSTTTEGYAKVYKSLEEAKKGENDYILVRNGVLVKEKKPAKEEKPVKPSEIKPKEGIEPPTEISTEKPLKEKDEEVKKSTGKEIPESSKEEKSKEKLSEEDNEKSDNKQKSDTEKKE